MRQMPEVEAEIKDTLECLDMMRENLTIAARGIKPKGRYLLSRATNNKGEVVTTEKLNPVFKVQREAMSAAKSLKPESRNQIRPVPLTCAHFRNSV
jgi:hypothetical protein